MSLKPVTGQNQKKKRPCEVSVVVESPHRVGVALRSTLKPVLKELPSCSMRPTDISRLLDVSRVMVGRVLSSIAKEDPIE
ncbi:MAG: hypothetical protein JJ974_11825, partial [Phycisphaerales bacterium]|nr:hypothetical protein [Phycisphaerales bacterium]